LEVASLLPQSFDSAAPLRTCTVTLVSRPSLHTLRNDGVLIAYIWMHGENIRNTAYPLYCRKPCDCERDQSMGNACTFHPFTIVAAPCDCELDQSIANTLAFCVGGEAWRILSWYSRPSLLSKAPVYGSRDQWACCEWGAKLETTVSIAWTHGEQTRGTADPLYCQKHLCTSVFSGLVVSGGHRPFPLSRAPMVTSVISGLVVSGGRSWKRLVSIAYIWTHGEQTRGRADPLY